MMLESIRYVDLVIPEKTWEQKRLDVAQHEIDLVVMGSDWEGSPRFEYLRERCEVVYLPRTQGTSTSEIRRDLLFEAIQYKQQDELILSGSAVQCPGAADRRSRSGPGSARLPVGGNQPGAQHPLGPAELVSEIMHSHHIIGLVLRAEG